MRSWGIRVIGALALVLAVAGVGLALTGSLTYVTTHGVSMEPGFHRGDLAVVRSSDRYEVGDVVAYRSDLLDTTVMHRIVDRKGERYIFKGDNNTWLDRDEPTAEAFLGRLLFRVPRGGSMLGLITRPPVMAAALAMAVGLGGAGRRARRPGARRMAATKHAAPPSPRVAQVVRRTAWGAAAVLCASLFLASQAFATPATQQRATKVGFTHQSTFGYSAPVPDDRVYQAGEVRTDDPVFRRVTDVLDLDFGYRLVADGPHAVGGTIEMLAEIRNSSGWTRTIELSSSRRFRGDRASAEARLDLTEVQRLIDEAEALTGLPQAGYDLTVLPRVELTGTVAGRPVAEAFTPKIAFSLEDAIFRPAEGGPDASGPDHTYPLSGSSAVSTTVPEPRTFGVVGGKVSVGQARVLAASGSAVAAVVLAVAVVMGRSSRRDEPARIEARHGHRIIPVATSGDNGRHDIIDVTTMEDLVRLAEQYGCLVLNRDVDGVSTYLFQVERTIYRFQVRGRRQMRTAS